MKFMFASDIHGSEYFCDKLLKRLEIENPQRLFLLGDILYHGPRNDLPKGYNPKGVIEKLNAHREIITSVRGNCDTEVDQMVLNFPIMADYAMLFLEGRSIFMTHGHKHNLDNIPPIAKGDILLHGHTHIQAMLENEECVYINPGSVSIPKEQNENSYMTYEDGLFEIKNLDGNTIMSYKISREERS